MATTRDRHLPQWARVVASLLSAAALISLQFSHLVQVSRAEAACIGPLIDCTTGAIVGGGVNLVRSKVTPGTGATPAKKVFSGPIVVVPKPSLTTPVMNLQCSVIVPRPWYCPALPTVRVTPAIPATPTVTLADLANFMPQTPLLRSEPAGWGIVDLPVNLIVTVTTHDVPGRLLGASATVRFTPVRYSWTYGDGQTRVTTVPGGSWSGLGLAPFSATTTSHTFAQAGLYPVQVAVIFSASYRLGSGSWQAISGTVQRPASVTVRISSGSVPVLVTQGCRLGQADIGC